MLISTVQRQTYMTLFYKQLILLSLLIVVILSGSGYFVYKGLNEIVASFAEDSAVLIARDFKNIFNSVNEKLDNRENWNSAQNKSLRQELLHFTQYHEQVQDFFVVNKDTQIVFSLKPENTAVSFWKKIDNPANHTDLQLAKSKDSNKFQVSWKLPDFGEGSLTAVLTVNPENIIRDEKHELYVRFYLIGFAGIFGVFLIAATSQRLLHLPMRTVEKAMMHIDKRRY